MQQRTRDAIFIACSELSAAVAGGLRRAIFKLPLGHRRFSLEKGALTKLIKDEGVRVMPNRSSLHELTNAEITIGSGRTQIILRGRDAILAAGWSLRFLLFARALFFLEVGTLALWWLSLRY